MTKHHKGSKTIDQSNEDEWALVDGKEESQMKFRRLLDDDEEEKKED